MTYLTDLSSMLVGLAFVGFLTETVVELLKSVLATKLHKPEHLYNLSIVVGILLCFALNISLFTNENLFAYYIGMVICGLVASRGSNYAHNWLDTMPKKVSE